MPNLRNLQGPPNENQNFQLPDSNVNTNPVSTTSVNNNVGMSTFRRGETIQFQNNFQPQNPSRPPSPIDNQVLSHPHSHNDIETSSSAFVASRFQQNVDGKNNDILNNQFRRNF